VILFNDLLLVISAGSMLKMHYRCVSCRVLSLCHWFSFLVISVDVSHLEIDYRNYKKTIRSIQWVY